MADKFCVRRGRDFGYIYQHQEITKGPYSPFEAFIKLFIDAIKLRPLVELTNGNENGMLKLDKYKFQALQEIYNIEQSRRKAQIKVNDLEKELTKARGNA